METIQNFRNLIEFAIEEEKRAQAMYGRMAQSAEDPFVKSILEGLRDAGDGARRKKLLALLSSIKT